VFWDDDEPSLAWPPDARTPLTRFRDALAWAGEPLSWRDSREPLPKLRATARRGREAVRLSRRIRPGRGESEQLSGFVLRQPSDLTAPLYAAQHPVTGDLLLSNRASEARELGYSEAVAVGHLIAEAPVTGSLGVRPVRIPWARRFGIGDAR
jgi:hypothetical protein